MEDYFLTLIGAIWRAFVLGLRGSWQRTVSTLERDKVICDPTTAALHSALGPPCDESSSVSNNNNNNNNNNKNNNKNKNKNKVVSAATLPSLSTHPLMLEQHLWVLEQCLCNLKKSTRAARAGEVDLILIPHPPPASHHSSTPIFLLPAPPVTHALAFSQRQQCSKSGITYAQALAYLHASGHHCPSHGRLGEEEVEKEEICPLRGRLFLDAVISDMAAFKHFFESEKMAGRGLSTSNSCVAQQEVVVVPPTASPTLHEFLLWYFCINGQKKKMEEEEEEEEEGGSSRGKSAASPGASAVVLPQGVGGGEEGGAATAEAVCGEGWVQLWESTPSCAASRQQSTLFDAECVGERTLHALENLSATEVCAQLVSLASSSCDLFRVIQEQQAEGFVFSSSPPLPSQCPTQLISTVRSLLQSSQTLATSVAGACQSLPYVDAARKPPVLSVLLPALSDEESRREAMGAQFAFFSSEVSRMMDGGGAAVNMCTELLTCEASLVRWSSLKNLLQKCLPLATPFAPASANTADATEMLLCDTDAAASVSFTAAQVSFPSGRGSGGGAEPPHRKNSIGGGGAAAASERFHETAFSGVQLLSGGQFPSPTLLGKLLSSSTSSPPWGSVSGTACRTAVASLIKLCSEGGGAGVHGEEYVGGDTGLSMDALRESLLPPPHNASLLISSSVDRDFILPYHYPGEQCEKRGLRHSVIVTVDNSKGSGGFSAPYEFNTRRFSLALALQERE